MIYWAGCNYYINRGNNEREKVGTATSMHDCEGCDRLKDCLIKKSTDTWEINDEIVKEMDEK